MVSIITVVRNDYSGLQETILSIKAQTFKDYEFIVIDGKSSDNTTDLLKQYKDIISIGISETDNGIYDAMNKGLIVSTGRWIVFLNAGDTFYDEASLSKLFIDYSETVKNSDAIFCSFYVESYWGDFEKKVYSEKNLWKGFCHQATYIRNDTYKKIGLYDTRYKSAADFNLIYKILEDPDFKKDSFSEIMATVSYNLNSFSAQHSILSRFEVVKTVLLESKKLSHVFFRLPLVSGRLIVNIFSVLIAKLFPNFINFMRKIRDRGGKN
ncbi:glycosyltransferase [Breznakiella homolactica]|nr:glycosyltransferase [Breznakiella homolactica]